MLNIEKYKGEIKAEIEKDKTLGCVVNKLMGNKCDDYPKCNDCYLKVLDWLLQECKEPILDDIEKEYLSAVIKPFRKRIKSIKKSYCSGNSAYITIAMDKCEHIFLPNFNLNSGMYKRMEIDKEYTLKELSI